MSRETLIIEQRKDRYLWDSERRESGFARLCVGLFARQLTSAARGRATIHRRATCTHYALNEAAISPLDLGCGVAAAAATSGEQLASSRASPFQGLRRGKLIAGPPREHRPFAFHELPVLGPESSSEMPSKKFISPESRHTENLRQSGTKTDWGRERERER